MHAKQIARYETFPVTAQAHTHCLCRKTFHVGGSQLLMSDSVRAPNKSVRTKKPLCQNGCAMTAKKLMIRNVLPARDKQHTWVRELSLVPVRWTTVDLGIFAKGLRYFTTSKVNKTSARCLVIDVAGTISATFG